MLAELTLDIDALIQLARKAGADILKIYGREDFAIQTKADQSPLTDADLASHQRIVASLAELTPDIPVLSEESATIPWSERRQWQRYWLIDPLDGTKEFVKRNGEFTVNIALIEHHQPVLGIVYAPVTDVLWLGGASEPARKIEAGVSTLIHVKAHQTGEVWQVVGSRSHAGDSLAAWLEGLGDYELLPVGSSIKLCWVAEGKAHVYPRLGPTSEWDTAAAHAVVNAAGGEVVEYESKQTLMYNQKESLLNAFFVVQTRFE